MTTPNDMHAPVPTLTPERAAELVEVWLDEEGRYRDLATKTEGDVSEGYLIHARDASQLAYAFECVVALAAERSRAEQDLDALEMAWGIIANANGGDWDEAEPEWKDAAVRWRDQYMSRISAALAARAARTPHPEAP